MMALFTLDFQNHLTLGTIFNKVFLHLLLWIVYLSFSIIIL